MRPSLVVQWTRAVPLSAIPATSLRLPPAAGRSRRRAQDEAASPTVDRLLSSIDRSAHRLQRQGSPQTPRRVGEAGAEGVAVGGTSRLPPNLRINEFVPRRKVYEGVKASHRDLLRRLRREA
ncbi:hypothetical protein JCM10908_007304 [Rhodotorula pacifica]|uniref:uncharacterized protein n=1 Tax=Rhodotorula pacifica TaxID=1495444 RepID=UPI00317E2955